MPENRYWIIVAIIKRETFKKYIAIYYQYFQCALETSDGTHVERGGMCTCVSVQVCGYVLYRVSQLGETEEGGDEEGTSLCSSPHFH